MNHAPRLKCGAMPVFRRAMAREIERLASSRAGRNAYAAHAIETAEAIPFNLLLEKVDGFAKQRAAILRSLHKQGRMRHLPIG